MPYKIVQLLAPRSGGFPASAPNSRAVYGVVQIMIRPILQDVCYHEGRGPILAAVRYANEGRSIRAVEYDNLDAGPSDETKHLRFVQPQVYLWTPEEVYRSRSAENYWAMFRPAAVISLGKSPWLLSFSQQHLAKCSHFQIMFYDDYLDIICEDVIYGQGVYQPDY